MTASDTAARVGDLLAGSEYTVTVAAVNTRGEVSTLYVHYMHYIYIYIFRRGPG